VVDTRRGSTASFSGVLVNHQAAVYTARVRRGAGHPGDLRLLGDIDNQGTFLGSVLASYMIDFRSSSAEKARTVACGGTSVHGDETFLALSHEEAGVAADILGKDGRKRTRQSADETQQVRRGARFSRLLTAMLPEADGGYCPHHLMGVRFPRTHSLHLAIVAVNER